MINDTLIENLQNPELYSHPIKSFQVFESHISWVILTGDVVYKIKKPVDFVFLNFSTLEKRDYYCHEEIRLNKILTPELYMDVVTINGSVDNPKINGAGEIIEYAVRMHQFPQENIFINLLAENKLTSQMIDGLAKQIADFHKKTYVAPLSSSFGSPANVHAPVMQNFDQILPFLTSEEEKNRLKFLRQWADEQFTKHHELFQQRKQQGFIRDCHGDLHLKNIVLYQGKPLLFDRIEFNDEFRWTDVVADIAFLSMDLDDNQQSRFSYRLINDYFNATGDYEGLALLPYYLSYRAVVRAKVALFSLSPENLSETERAALWQHHRHLMKLAEQYTQVKTPALLITHGLSGSGKSSLGRLLVEELGAIQINSDIERKRLFGLPADAHTNAELNTGLYSVDNTLKTYRRLLQISELIIKAQYTVIVDATFLKTEQREQFFKLATALNVPFAILHCQAPHEKLEEWIRIRKESKQDPSEADIRVLAMQEKSTEPLTEQEKKHTIEINTAEFNQQAVLEKIYSILK